MYDHMRSGGLAVFIGAILSFHEAADANYFNAIGTVLGNDNCTIRFLMNGAYYAGELPIVYQYEQDNEQESIETTIQASIECTPDCCASLVGVADGIYIRYSTKDPYNILAWSKSATSHRSIYIFIGVLMLLIVFVIFLTLGCLVYHKTM